MSGDGMRLYILGSGGVANVIGNLRAGVSAIKYLSSMVPAVTGRADGNGGDIIDRVILTGPGLDNNPIRIEAGGAPVKIRYCGQCGKILRPNQTACPVRARVDKPMCPICGAPLLSRAARRANICPSCRAEHVNGYYSYHGWHDEPVFSDPRHRATALHMGYEWETHVPRQSRPSVTAKTLATCANTNVYSPAIHIEADGSLANGGCECISEPCTWRAHVARRDNYNAIACAISNGDVYVDSSAGLHVHVDRDYYNRADKIASLKIAYLIARWQWLFDVLDERHGRHGYCYPAGLKTVKICESDVLDEYDKLASHAGHNTAVNIGNANTIEVRIWAAPATLDGLYMRLDLTQAIARMAKRITYTQLGKIEVGKIGEYLNAAATLDECDRIIARVDDGPARRTCAAALADIRAAYNRTHKTAAATANN